jgi:hypothetical protein
LKYTTPIGSAYAANIRVRRTDGSIDVVIIIFYEIEILLYSMILEYNNDWKWTSERMSELFQHIVNIELIQTVHYQRNNGCKTSIMTPYTTI